MPSPFKKLYFGRNDNPGLGNQGRGYRVASPYGTGPFISTEPGYSEISYIPTIYGIELVYDYNAPGPTPQKGIGTFTVTLPKEDEKRNATFLGVPFKRKKKTPKNLEGSKLFNQDIQTLGLNKNFSKNLLNEMACGGSVKKHQNGGHFELNDARQFEWVPGAVNNYVLSKDLRGTDTNYDFALNNIKYTIPQETITVKSVKPKKEKRGFLGLFRNRKKTIPEESIIMVDQIK